MRIYLVNQLTFQNHEIQISKGIENMFKGKITNILHINSINSVGLYLGCQDIHKQIGKREISNIMEKIKSKLIRWAKKNKREHYLEL